MKTFKTVAEIKKFNAAQGYYFFSKGAMGMFNTHVYPYIYAGRFFITSDHFSEESKFYSVREVLENGRILRLDFEGIDSLDEARRMVKLHIKDSI